MASPNRAAVHLPLRSPPEVPAGGPSARPQAVQSVACAPLDSLRLNLQVRYVGERELPDRLSMEHLKTEERVVEETHTAPCSPFNCGDCTGGQPAYAANTVGPRKANFAPPARWAGVVISAITLVFWVEGRFK